QHSLRYPVAIHSFASMFWKQSRMYVHNTSRVCIEYRFGYFQQKTGQNDEINFIFAKYFHDLHPIIKFSLGKRKRWYTKLFSSFVHKCIDLIGKNEFNSTFGVIFKVGSYIFGIATTTRGKDGDIGH